MNNTTASDAIGTELFRDGSKKIVDSPKRNCASGVVPLL